MLVADAEEVPSSVLVAIASPPEVESEPVPTAMPPLVEVEVVVDDVVSSPLEAEADASTAPSTASDEVVVAVPVDVEVTVAPSTVSAVTNETP